MSAPRTARHAAPSKRDPARAGRSPLRPDIQALRALAVALVVLYHAGLPTLTGGYIGVDVFYVISGYLITGHLLREASRGGRIAFGAFYARRIRRLLPAAMVVLVATLVAAYFVVPPLAMPAISADGRSAALFFSNIRFGINGIEYLGNQDPSPFQQYWSLSLEEQFYALWPLLLALVLLLARRSGSLRRYLTITFVAVFVISLAVSYELTGYRQPLAFFLLPSRAWEFALGALVGLLPSTPAWLRERWVAGLLVIGGLAAVLGTAFWLNGDSQFPGVIAVLPAAGTALVILAGPTAPRSVISVLSLRPVQWVGAISYSLYLWHWPLLTIPVVGTGRGLSAPARTGAVIAAVVLAYGTYRLVEQPLRGNPLLSRHRRNTYGFGAVLIVAACAISVVTAGLPTLSAGRSAPVLADPATASQLTATAYVPDNMTPTLRQASGDIPTLYATGCQANFAEETAKGCATADVSSSNIMVLFGDSHAAQWFPALKLIAAARHLKLVTFTKSACPSVSLSVYNKLLVRNYTECTVWRRDAIAKINALHPNTVIVSNYGVYDDGSNGDTQYQSDWGRALATTLAKLGGAAHRYVIADTPHFDYEIPICLSAHLSNTAHCDKPENSVIDPLHRTTEEAVARTAGYNYIDSTQWTCPRGTCDTVQGNVLMYRDQQHLTATYAQRLSGVLGSAMTTTAS
ncbi:acyltransferase family protein [Jatrophihabitans sp.]|uniref:acyltransferase family protein n=1 Tax=Jatrophihabitans sp. TaxID=1932789 RepID=UPI0030C6DEF4|nr:acyltransferase [Jatrophihabitans sp.]